MSPSPSGLLGVPGLFNVPLIHATRFGDVAPRTDSYTIPLERESVEEELGLAHLIHIAHRPTFSDIKMDRDIGSVEIAPAIGSIGNRPFIC